MCREWSSLNEEEEEGSGEDGETSDGDDGLMQEAVELVRRARGRDALSNPAFEAMVLA